MNASRRARAIRTIAGALLASELPASDIRHVAELLEDRQFRDDLGRAVFAVYAFAQQSAPNEKPSAKLRRTDGDALLNLIQKKRLSKAWVINRMREIAPNISTASLDERLTMRELVQTFLRSGPDRAIEFVNQLENSQKDAYLKGILSR